MGPRCGWKPLRCASSNSGVLSRHETAHRRFYLTIGSIGDVSVTNLTRASRELFNREPDERFTSIQTLWDHCRAQKEGSLDRWHPPSVVSTVGNGELHLQAGSDGIFAMNDWSFSQLCRMAGIAKDTVNRLQPSTASQVLRETLPGGGNKPLQILTNGQTIRSIHGTQYTRLWNADLVAILSEFAVDFQPPQAGCNGGTGLYCGEQDMFCFLIDPLGWTEIGGENFAPGFFIWNSEVGRRALGIQTFWFQAVCQNHIVWDAVEVVEWTRKHTANVHEGLSEIRRIIADLVKKRDERKDGFAAVIRKAMEEKIGDDADEALSVMTKKGITRAMAKKALEIAKEQGRFTIWSLVDALTRLSSETGFAGDRLEADEKAAALLQLV